MRKSFFMLALVAVLAVPATGCKNTSKKLGRGIRNITEFARLGEIRRSMEQSTLTDGWEYGATTGFIQGFNKSIARTGVGIYEIVTAPFPSYDPPFPDYLPDKVAYPDSYKPRPGSTLFEADTALGFMGGDVAPMVPGSKFRVFDF
jgi:putative exosortase-associated protein (TIGR04073 family)